jgi:hypothetical protein
MLHPFMGHENKSHKSSINTDLVVKPLENDLMTADIERLW